MPMSGSKNKQVDCSDCSLSSLCVANGLNEIELTEFSRSVKSPKPHKKNQMLISSGDSVRAVNAVKSGTFKGTITVVNGNTHITGFYYPGELLGFDGLSEAGHHCDVIAVEQAQVCELPIDELDVMCGKFPALHREMCTVGSRSIKAL